MHKPSKERVNAIARQLVDAMDRLESVHLLKDRDAVRQSVVHSLVDEFRHEEERQQGVLLRVPTELQAGSKEWESAVRKLLEEEYDRSGIDNG
jgi:hypothetical protein